MVLAFVPTILASPVFAVPPFAGHSQVIATGSPDSSQKPEAVAVQSQASDFKPDVLAPPRSLFPQSDLASVVQHVKSRLTSELYENFRLFVYVNKAARGPWAQHMFVLRKQPDNTLVVLEDWPISTGRELNETNGAGAMLATTTPQGFYQLDPQRLYVSHRSVQWDEPMPYAMFFNWTRDGKATGLAIHAATEGEISLLGTRASAGCVRLSPQAAQDLFVLIQTDYRGAAPMFEAYSRDGPSGNGGSLRVNPDGSFQLADGYSVLVFIEDFGGDTTAVALP